LHTVPYHLLILLILEPPCGLHDSARRSDIKTARLDHPDLGKFPGNRSPEKARRAQSTRMM